MKELLLLTVGSAFVLWCVVDLEKERDAAISQRDAALQQADELAKRVVELERANPMARIQSMPEALQGED